MDDRTEEQPTSGSQDADAGPGSTVPVKDPRRTAAKIGFAAWIVVVVTAASIVLAVLGVLFFVFKDQILGHSTSINADVKVEAPSAPATK